MSDSVIIYVLVGTVFLVFGVFFALVSRSMNKQQKFLEENGVPTEAQIVTVRRESSDGNGVPDFRIRVSYQVDGEELFVTLRMNYWTVRANFPQLVVTDGGGAATTMHALERAREFTELSKRLKAEGKSKDEIKDAVLKTHEENQLESYGFGIPIVYDREKPQRVAIDYTRVEKKTSGFITPNSI